MSYGDLIVFQSAPEDVPSGGTLMRDTHAGQRVVMWSATGGCNVQPCYASGRTIAGASVTTLTSGSAIDAPGPFTLFTVSTATCTVASF